MGVESPFPTWEQQMRIQILRFPTQVKGEESTTQFAIVVDQACDRDGKPLKADDIEELKALGEKSGALETLVYRDHVDVVM